MAPTSVGLTIVSLDRALVSSYTVYRLSIVTMLLTEAVLPQFTMYVFGRAVNISNLGRNEEP